MWNFAPRRSNYTGFDVLRMLCNNPDRNTLCSTNFGHYANVAHLLSFSHCPPELFVNSLKKQIMRECFFFCFGRMQTECCPIIITEDIQLVNMAAVYADNMPSVDVETKTLIGLIWKNIKNIPNPNIRVPSHMLPGWLFVLLLVCSLYFFITAILL